MTVEELLARESIRHTIASYNMAGDRLRMDEFIAVFTEDAILESDGVPEKDAFRHVGSQAIRAWFTRWGRGSREAEPVHQAKFIRHHLSTCQIELTGPDTAKARTYWVAYTDIGPDHCGYYVDAFRKTGERWLISHRKVRLDWKNAGSLYSSAIVKLWQ
ncbi:MAG: nuclear transport factor 2 family protein [Rhodospirillaceae bacterium]|nr:MAG: nuclear transport factor 2 family protein [Rhodospirillaceae bacterium]